MRKASILIAASSCVLLSTIASQACFMMGIADQGGDCAAKCAAYGKPYWACMLGSTGPQHGTQGINSQPPQPSAKEFGSRIFGAR